MNHFSAPTRRLSANLAHAVAAPLCSAVVVAIAAVIALAAGGGGDEAQIDSASPVARAEQSAQAPAGEPANRADLPIATQEPGDEARPPIDQH